jgi:hypothetical protein
MLTDDRCNWALTVAAIKDNGAWSEILAVGALHILEITSHLSTSQFTTMSHSSDHFENVSHSISYQFTLPLTLNICIYHNFPFSLSYLCAGYVKWWKRTWKDMKWCERCEMNLLSEYLLLATSDTKGHTRCTMHLHWYETNNISLEKLRFKTKFSWRPLFQILLSWCWDNVLVEAFHHV